MRSAALVPGRSLYLKMKLFLKRHSRTSSTVCRKVLLRLATETNNEVARHGGIAEWYRRMRAIMSRYSSTV